MSINNHKSILVLTDWYLPGYKAGGPIRSLANLIATLKDVQFYVVTRNTDHFSSEPYQGIETNTWVKHSDNCHVFYFDEKSISLSKFKQLMRERTYDKIYLNSLFSPKFTILPLIAIKRLKLQNKTILAPRGMLKAGALTVKANKKRAFLSLSKLLKLYSNIQWHATSDDEVKEIQHHFSKAKIIHLAPNIATSIGEKPMKSSKQVGELKLVCLARISAEKGIKEALNYLQVAQLEGSVSCDFYGTIQNQDFLNECKQIASSIPNVSIEFKGEIPPHQIPETLNRYHFFYLPTLGENFGHAIAEALNSATPVIISNKTPWINLKAKNAGWDLPLDAQAFRTALKECLQMNNATYQEMSDAAYQFALEKNNNEEVIKAQYNLFA